MVKTINLQEFLDGYENGTITDIISIKNAVYGKDSSISSRPKTFEEREKIFETVRADLP